jgi:hypothetical protein
MSLRGIVSPLRSNGFRSCRFAVAFLAALVVPAAARAQQANQPIDQEYTAKIKEYLTDSRISTELVSYMPASSTVPTPLKFLGRIVGTPGELTHAADIHRYLQAVANAAPQRAKFWTIGKTEEGRDMVVLAIGDEQTMSQLTTYKSYVNALSDPRKTSDARAKEIISAAKPIYWVTSGMHSPERGGPEMLMELAYRLVVDESPFIQNIRKNVITFITPVIEVDGRERMVDTYYFNKKLAASNAAGAVGAAGAAGAPGGGGRGGATLPLMYWGKYVQHDNNRDGIGQFLALTQNVNKLQNEWTPQILHDLHESVTYLYASTGEGPYNEALDPITIDEWWLLAKNDVSELTKRGVPGVWTYGYYDGWAPNYMFFVAHSHNATGRFYEVQSYGPENGTVNGGNAAVREWFRPNPALPTIKWGPRANTNIQESGMLFALSYVAKNRESFLENYWLKNKRAMQKGIDGPLYGWVVPANQWAKANAAEAVNDLRRQGLEFHTATSAFHVGNIDVKPGDYIIRGDQPLRTIADFLFPLQRFSPSNPSPYDDTGWTLPLMRNVSIIPVMDKSLLSQSMTPVTSDVRAAGGIAGSGRTVVIDNTADNNLVTFRFRFPNMAMQATEMAFDVAGRHFAPGAIVINNANRGMIEPALRELGLSAVAMNAAPPVRMHNLDVPRIGYVHSWSRTQDEGWVRAALDHYGVPYKYFGEPLLKEGNLRAKYDVIIYPTGGTGYTPPAGGPGGQGAGAPGAGGDNSGAVSVPPAGKPIPFMRSAEFPALGYPDSTSDIRGGVGADGMKALYDFVRQGGTLITEGGTASIFPNLNLAPGVKVEPAGNLFVRGSVMRGMITDKNSPLVYGYQYNEVPVYFSSGPILNANNAPANEAPPAPAGGGRGAAQGRQNTTPNAGGPIRLSPWDPAGTGTPYGMMPADTAAGNRGRGAGNFGGGGGGRQGGGGAAGAGVPGLVPDAPTSTRVVMQFPAKADDMLLSGTIENGYVLQNRAQLVDEKIGTGHLVMFAIRPYWRWETHGNYALGFNAIMNWNDLDAGK